MVEPMELEGSLVIELEARRDAFSLFPPAGRSLFDLHRGQSLLEANGSITKVQIQEQAETYRCDCLRRKLRNVEIFLGQLVESVH